jgi:hypothetical protein
MPMPPKSMKKLFLDDTPKPSKRRRKGDGKKKLTVLEQAAQSAKAVAKSTAFATAPNLKKNANETLAKSSGMIALSILNAFVTYDIKRSKATRKVTPHAEIANSIKRRNDESTLPAFIQHLIGRIQEKKSGAKRNKLITACAFAAVLQLRKLRENAAGRSLSFYDFIDDMHQDFAKGQPVTFNKDLKLLLPGDKHKNTRSVIRGRIRELVQNLQAIGQTSRRREKPGGREKQKLIFYRDLYGPAKRNIKNKRLWLTSKRRQQVIRYAESQLTADTEWDSATDRFTNPTTNSKKSGAWVAAMGPFSFFSLTGGTKAKAGVQVPIATSPVTLSVGVGGGVTRAMMVQCVAPSSEYNVTISRELSASLKVGVQVPEAISASLGLEVGHENGVVLHFRGDNSQRLLTWFIAEIMAGHGETLVDRPEFRTIFDNPSLLYAWNFKTTLTASAGHDFKASVCGFDITATAEVGITGTRSMIVGRDRHEENLDLFFAGTASVGAGVKFKFSDAETAADPADAYDGSDSTDDGNKDSPEDAIETIGHYFDAGDIVEPGVAVKAKAEVSAVTGIGRRYVYTQGPTGPVRSEANRLEYTVAVSATAGADVSATLFHHEKEKKLKLIEGKRKISTQQPDGSWSPYQEETFAKRATTSDRTWRFSLLDFGCERINVVEHGTFEDKNRWGKNGGGTAAAPASAVRRP